MELYGLSGNFYFTAQFHARRSAMNWDRVEGNWKQFKGKMQTQWGRLTDDDFDVIKGKRTELSGKIQARYGIARDEAERQIDDWLKKTND
jgi:uncharacterized protein YjbJ (UPF0337 family)